MTQFPAATIPADRDAEYRLIAAVATTPQLWAGAGLEASAFYDQEAGKAWARLEQVARGDVPAIPDDYSAFFKSDFVTPLPEFVAEDARRVRQAAFGRSALLRATEIARAAYAGDTDRLTLELARVGELRPTHGASTLMTAFQVADETFCEIVDRDKLAAALVPSGIPTLDKALGGGFERGTSTMFPARPSMGKTALLAQVADLASAHGRVVAVFSKEMTRKQWWRRMACRRARVSWLDFKQNNVTEQQEHAVLDWVMKLAERDTLYIDDSTPQTTAEVFSACEELRRQHGGKLDLIIADHLRLFSDRADNETHRLGAVSWGFKQMAKRLDAAALVAVQLSRAIEQGKGDRRPDLKDIRDSGEVEENADNVIMLYRDEYYTNAKKNVTAELIFRKSRDGERGAVVKLAFISDIMSFEGLAPNAEITGKIA